MKSKVMPLQDANGTIQLCEELKNKLKTAITEETLATGAGDHRNKKLTAADMWNLQRNSRSASAMLRKWYLN